MFPMLPHLGQAALNAPRQQPTRQGLLGQARSVVGGLLGGAQDQFRRGQESDEGFNLLRFRPPPGMNQSEMIMLAGAGLQDLDPLFGGGRMQAAQQMIDQRIQGRQAEEQRLAQMEQFETAVASVLPTLDPDLQAQLGSNSSPQMLERVQQEQIRRGRPVAPPTDPTAVREYQLAVEQGFQGSFMDFDAARRRAGAAQNDVPTAFQALELRAAAAGLQPGTEEYRTFMLNNGAMPEAEPDPSALRLGAEAMGRIAPNIAPLLAAQRQLQELERQGVTFTQGLGGVGATVAAGIPFVGGALERAIGSDDRDAMVRAVSQFEAAILPILSGAAVTDSEAQRYVRAQLPQPGDSARIRDLKAQARQGMIDVFQAAIRGEAVDFAAMDAAAARIEREMAAERQRQRDERRGGQNQTGTRLRFNPETGEVE